MHPDPSACSKVGGLPGQFLLLSRLPLHRVDIKGLGTRTPSARAAERLKGRLCRDFTKGTRRQGAHRGQTCPRGRSRTTGRTVTKRDHVLCVVTPSLPLVTTVLVAQDTPVSHAVLIRRYTRPSVCGFLTAQTIPNAPPAARRSPHFGAAWRQREVLRGPQRRVEAGLSALATNMRRTPCIGGQQADRGARGPIGRSCRL